MNSGFRFWREYAAGALQQAGCNSRSNVVRGRSNVVLVHQSADRCDDRGRSLRKRSAARAQRFCEYHGSLSPSALEAEAYLP